MVEDEVDGVRDGVFVKEDGEDDTEDEDMAESSDEEESMLVEAN